VIRCCLALAWALAAPGVAAAASDPFQTYRSWKPQVADEDLLAVAARDSVARVLAVVYNPDSGVAPRSVRITELGANGPVERAVEALAGEAGDTATGTFLVSVTQRCDGPAPPGRESVGSWFYLPGNRLQAWQLQPYGPACRAEAPLFEASDHDAMRVVGEQLFRPARRGSFRYGALVYEEWNDAFGAATREATLSLLRAGMTGHERDARAYNRLAVGLYAAGETRDALAALHKAARLDPAWGVPHRNLSVIYLRLGDREGAARERELAESGDASDVSSPSGP
jgi:tetratricopeptide (TPR) repeat protein